MNIRSWKRWMVIALCMLLPWAACAEDQTLSADALNEANALPALRAAYGSLMVDELVQMDETAQQQTLWDGTTSDGRSLQIAMLPDEQRMSFVLDGVFYEYDMTQGTLFCCAWLPGSRETFAANWDAQLQIFAEDTCFVPGEGGTAVAELATVSEDGAIHEAWRVDAATHALQSYVAEAKLKDENGEETTETYLLTVTYGAASLLTDDMLGQISDESFVLTLIDEHGSAAQQRLPSSLPIRFTDGENRLLFFRDAAFEQPVDLLDPAAEDVTGGVTLYYSSEAD